MFSPIVATRCVSSSATVRPEPGNGAALIASRSSPTWSAILATASTKAWNVSLRATKSVSAFTSTIAARLGADATPTSPSAATRPDFFAAAAKPFLRSQSTAASMSPSVSVSAFLQSIMPAPVFSRRSFTRAAVISAMVRLLASGVRGVSAGTSTSGIASGGRSSTAPISCPEAAISALMPSSTAPATRSQYIVMARIASSLPGIGKVTPAGSELLSRMATTGMSQLVRFLDRELLLVRVDDEQDVRQAAHLLDAAQRAFELLRSRVMSSTSFLVRPSMLPLSSSSIWRSRLIEPVMVFQLVSVPPSQRWLT